MNKRDVIVITGGASGIGRAMVDQWLKKGGVKIFALDINVRALREMQEAYRDAGGHELETAVCDITSEAAVEDFFKRLERGAWRVATWVNCAGTAGIGDFTKTSASEYEKTLELNLLAVVRLTRKVTIHMQNQGFGRVVNFSSVAGFVPAPYMSAYNLTKHALVGFTRSLQLEMELTGSPVEFVLVCPGFVRTEMVKLGQEMGFPEWMSPLLATPEDTAREILKGLAAGKSEIFPTMNGKMMLRLYKHFPKFLSRRSRLLLTRDWKDLLLNRVS